MSNQAIYTKQIKKMPPHGLTGTPEYWAWRDIKKRCYNPNNKWYKNYGGRGIKMYEPWITSFVSFLQYVGNRPDRGYSIDRIDNNGDYEPGNVKWSTKKEQDNNRRTTVLITENGVTKSYRQWSEHYNVKPDMLRYWILKGNSPKEAAERCK